MGGDPARPTPPAASLEATDAKLQVFDSMGRWTGIAACLLAAASAFSGLPAVATAGLALLGAVGVLVSDAYTRHRLVVGVRTQGRLAEAILEARSVPAIEALLEAEVASWPDLHLRWCALTPVVPSEPLDHPPGVARELRRVVARLRGNETEPVRSLWAEGEVIAAPCPSAAGLVFVVASGQERIADDVERRIAGLAVLAGVGARHAALDAKLDAQRDSSRFEELVRFSSDAIFIVDGGGIVRYAAPSVTSVLGHLSVDVEGRPLADLVIPDHAGDVLTFLANVQLQDARHAVTVALRFERGDGARIDGELTGANLLDNADVRGIVVTVRDVSGRVELEQQLRHQAFHDGLTGLANRALFRDRLDRAMRVRRSPTDHAPAVAFLDLDDFKNVNDSLGHGAGDALLQTVADRIQSCLRGADTAARLGGDEFAILLEDVPDDDKLVELLERVVEAVSEPITIGDDLVVRVTASAGVATATPDAKRSEDLLRHADMAMYRAKVRGKAQVARYESEMHRELHDRLALTSQLDAAIGRGELDVHYQPIVALDVDRIVAVEALVRWHHPERGLLEPAAFIDVAEESGLIVPLGAEVIRHALDDLVEWRSMGIEGLVVSVNVSPRQLLHDDFEASIHDALEDRALHPGCLLLEVTEAALGTDPSVSAPRLRRLAEHGVRIAVDDFGTGQSSLRSLELLPLHQLKIDRTFVAPLRTDGNGAIARTIVDFAAGIGAEAVAEGIEHPDELAALRRLGCPLGQGHLFGPPAPADAVLPMLLSTSGAPRPVR